MSSQDYPRQPERRGNPLRRWGTLFALSTLLFVAGCSGGSKTSTASAATATPPHSGPTSVPVPTYPPSLHLTPVPGNYSVYVDPTYGYSFQYPANWLVNPGIGADESNVAIQEPVYDLNDPNYWRHPFTTLMIRASANYKVTFVQHLLCGYGGGAFDTTVAGYPARTLDTYGGEMINNQQAYGAPAYGRVFYAKNVAFEIWLQSSNKIGIQAFFDDEASNWKQILKTFNPGPGVKAPVQGC